MLLSQTETISPPRDGKLVSNKFNYYIIGFFVSEMKYNLLLTWPI